MEHPICQVWALQICMLERADLVLCSNCIVMGAGSSCCGSALGFCLACSSQRPSLSLLTSWSLHERVQAPLKRLLMGLTSAQS